MQADHVQAVVTGATAVFVRDLYNCMCMYQQITQNDCIPDVARTCANYLLQMPKCQQLEHIVHQVMEHPDGMPVVDHPQLLQEIMEFYSDARKAEASGDFINYRKNQLIPKVMMQSNVELPEPSVAQHFVSTIDRTPYIKPQTAFQHIVCAAVDNLYK